MKKRVYSLLLFSVLALGLLAGCGVSRGSTASSADSSAAAPSEGWDTDESTQNQQLDSSTASNGASTAGTSQASAVRENAKLILTAEIYAETRDFTAADPAIQNLVTKYGGYLKARSVAGEEGARSANYTARVPQAHFEAFLSAVGGALNVVRQSQNAEDVGQEYFDTETHLKTLQTKHERLLVLLSKAEKMEDIIQLQNALSDTEYQIEQYSSTLQRYDDLISFSTIQIQLNEVRDLTSVNQGNSFFSDLRHAAATGTRGAAVVVKKVVLFAILIWPLLLICGAGFTLFVWLRRYRRKTEALPPAPPKELPDDEKGSTSQDQGNR